MARICLHNHPVLKHYQCKLDNMVVNQCPVCESGEDKSSTDWMSTQRTHILRWSSLVEYNWRKKFSTRTLTEISVPNSNISKDWAKPHSHQVSRFPKNIWHIFIISTFSTNQSLPHSPHPHSSYCVVFQFCFEDVGTSCFQKSISKVSFWSSTKMSLKFM